MIIILLILITLSLDSVWILLGENCCWSSLGLKGLRVKVSTVLSLHDGVCERKGVLTISFALDREVRPGEIEEKETKLFMMFSSPWGLTRLLFENG